MTVVVLDAGAMIALERRNTRMLALADELYGARRIGYVPAGVVAQTWRGSACQHETVRLLRAGAVRVDPLSEDVAYRLGLCSLSPVRRMSSMRTWRYSPVACKRPC